MVEVSIIGLDLAKNVFQAHGAASDGSVVFRRKLSRLQLDFVHQAAKQRACLVTSSGSLAKREPLPGTPNLPDSGGGRIGKSWVVQGPS